MTAEPQAPGANEEQLQYARVLEIGMYVGLLLLLVTFLLYLFGIVRPAIPVNELPQYWAMSVHEYLEAANHDYLHRDHPVSGWSWLWLLDRGDYLNFVGIAVLSAVTIVCFARITPTLVRQRDYIFAIIAVLEVAILTLAASGILSVGH